MLLSGAVGWVFPFNHTKALPLGTCKHTRLQTELPAYPGCWPVVHCTTVEVLEQLGMNLDLVDELSHHYRSLGHTSPAQAARAVPGEWFQVWPCGDLSWGFG